MRRGKGCAGMPAGSDRVTCARSCSLDTTMIGVIERMLSKPDRHATGQNKTSLTCAYMLA